MGTSVVCNCFYFDKKFSVMCANRFSGGVFENKAM